MKVSIVIPTYNRPQFVERALKSVLNQTFRDYEVLLVQNGPEDASRSVSDDFIRAGMPLRHIYTSKACAVNARNLGVRSHVSIYCNHSVRIGKNVLIGERVCITDVDHGYADTSDSVGKQPLKENTSVVLEDGCFIGFGAIILPNVRIGKNAVVGAGAVVTKDVPDYSIAAGNPTRAVKSIDN